MTSTSLAADLVIWTRAICSMGPAGLSIVPPRFAASLCQEQARLRYNVALEGKGREAYSRASRPSRYKPLEAPL